MNRQPRVRLRVLVLCTIVFILFGVGAAPHRAQEGWVEPEADAPTPDLMVGSSTEGTFAEGDVGLQALVPGNEGDETYAAQN